MVILCQGCSRHMGRTQAWRLERQESPQTRNTHITAPRQTARPPFPAIETPRLKPS